MMEDGNNDNEKKKELKCYNCEINIAVVWCESCAPGTYYCKDCDGSAHSMKALKNHPRISLREKSQKVTFSRCQCHMEDNKLFCLACEKLMCSVCKEDDHLDHKTRSVMKWAENLKKEWKDEVIGLDRIMDCFTHKEERLRKSIWKMEDEREALRRKLLEKEEDLKNTNLEKEKTIELKRKTETSQIVMLKLVEEMPLPQMLNVDFVASMKNTINKIYGEVFPIESQKELDRESQVVFDPTTKSSHAVINGDCQFLQLDQSYSLLSASVLGTEGHTNYQYWEIMIHISLSSPNVQVGLATDGFNPEAPLGPNNNSIALSTNCRISNLGVTHNCPGWSQGSTIGLLYHLKKKRLSFFHDRVHTKTVLINDIISGGSEKKWRPAFHVTACSLRLLSTEVPDQYRYLLRQN